MDDSTFLIRVIGATFVISVALVASCTATNVYTRAQAAQAMQAKGADPLDIPCSIGDGTERYCELRAAAKAAATR